MVFYFLDIPINNLPETYLEDLFGHYVGFDQFANEFAQAGDLLLVLVLVEVGGGGWDLLGD